MRYAAPQYLLSTVLVATFFGFTLGFVACHKLYSGMANKHNSVRHSDIETGSNWRRPAVLPQERK